METRRVTRGRILAGGAGFGLSVVVASSFVLVGARSGLPGSTWSPSSAALATATVRPAAGTPLVVGTLGPGPTASRSPGPTFDSIDLLATPTPGLRQRSFDPGSGPDPRRPIPTQSIDWLALKAAGRVAIVGGKIVILGGGVDPLVNPSTGAPVPAARTLDTSWTRWIAEPLGHGVDARGNKYFDLSLWNLCGDGAMTVSLWYWQQLTGHPDVTGTAGYFLDPYAEEGVAWPKNGPTVAVADGKRLGTYWSGEARAGGVAVNGRGYLMYLAMAVRPSTWESPGLAVFAHGGKAVYPTPGTPVGNIQAGLNWEASGHDPAWGEAYYATVSRADPTLARDLTAAVMLNVGRDGVPVLAAVDTFNLPNWQDGAATPHIRHAISIVGYDNSARPPTFTYTETCGRGCNNRGGNANGDLHVIPQADMVRGLQNLMGSGFVW